MTDPLIHSRALSDEEIKQLADPSNAMLSGLIEPEEPDRSISRKRVASYHVIGSGLHERPESFEREPSTLLDQHLTFMGLDAKGGRLWDQSKLRNHGNLGGTPRRILIPELSRYGLDLNGSSMVVTGRKGGETDTTSSALSCWFKVADASADRVVLGLSRITSQRGRWIILKAESAGVYKIALQSYAGSTIERIVSDDNYPLNEWVHVFATWLPWQMWVNGVKQSQTSTDTAGFSNSAVCYTVGCTYSLSTPMLVFTGQIADPMCFDGIPSESIIARLADRSNYTLDGTIRQAPKYFRGVTLSDAYTLQYRVDHGHERPESFELDYSHPLMRGCVFAGLGGVTKSSLYQDSSSFKNHGTLTNMDPPSDWVWVPELGRWGLDFDGSNDHVLLPSNDFIFSTTAVTISAWIRLASVNTRDMIASRWAAWGTPTVVNDRQVMFEANLGVLRSYVSTDGSFQSGNLAQGATTLSAGVLYHVACTFQAGTQHAVWLNGSIDGSDATPASTLHQATRLIMLGGEQSSAYPATLVQQYHGVISDPLIYNRVLSPAEIQQLADPSNAMLSGLIKPILSRSAPRPINDRHWVGRTSDYHDASNWSRSRGGPGRAGVPNENHNLYLDALTSEYED